MSTPRELSKILRMIDITSQKVKSDTYDSDSIKTKSSLNLPVSTLVVSSADTLPTSAPLGQQALVTSTYRFYLYNGSGWFNVAQIQNTPRFTTAPDASYTLDITGVATVVTVLGADSDGHDNDILSYTASGDSGFNAIATVQKDSDNGRVFVIRSIDSENSSSQTAGSGVLTFTVTDGKDPVTATSTFSIAFSANWANTPAVSTVMYGDLANGMWGNGASAASSDGSYTAVLEYGYSKVEIFYSSDLSTWAHQATIDGTGASTARSGNFGANKNVSFDDNGDRIVIGDHGSDRVYIYSRSGTTWSFEAEISPDTNSELYGQYGWSCAISGDGLYIVIGDRVATGSDYGGQVSVWLRTGTSWARQVKFSQPASSSNYGNAVDISKNGDYVIVGDWTQNSDTGKAYTYKRTGTSWALEGTLTASNAGSGDRFGIQVAINDDGSYAAVGAHYEDTGNTSAGSIYVFTRSGSTWSQQAQLGPNVNAANNYFGQSFDMSGDGKNIAGHRQNSSVYSIDIYDRTGSSWTYRRNLAKIGTEAYAGGLNGDVKFSRNGKVLVAGAGNQNNPTGPVSRTGALYIWKAG